MIRQGHCGRVLQQDVVRVGDGQKDMGKKSDKAKERRQGKSFPLPDRQSPNHSTTGALK